MGPTWALSAPGGPHVGPMNLAIRVGSDNVIMPNSWQAITWTSDDTVYVSLINSLAPGRSACNFENVVFKLALLIYIFKSSYDNVARWIPQELTDDKSTLVQVMAWCRQATSHYLTQCWPRSLSPYDVTRPQWVNSLNLWQNEFHFTDNIFKVIFMYGNCYILIEIASKFVSTDPIISSPELVHIMAWCWTGNKPLSKPLTVQITDATMCHLGPLLLTWFNFNPSMDKQSHTQ